MQRWTSCLGGTGSEGNDAAMIGSWTSKMPGLMHVFSECSRSTSVLLQQIHTNLTTTPKRQSRSISGRMRNPTGTPLGEEIEEVGKKPFGRSDDVGKPSLWMFLGSKFVSSLREHIQIIKQQQIMPKQCKS